MWEIEGVYYHQVTVMDWWEVEQTKRKEIGNWFRFLKSQNYEPNLFSLNPKPYFLYFNFIFFQKLLYNVAFKTPFS